MVHFGKFLKTWSLRSSSVTRHVSFNGTKIGGKCNILSTFRKADFAFLMSVGNKMGCVSIYIIRELEISISYFSL